MQLFADDTSLFSIVYDPNTSANELNKDLQKISEWAYQWEMSSNPDQNKQAQKVIFSRKITKSSLPQISFNNMPVFSVNFQKHLGIYLDEKLNFNYHIMEKICKAMQGVGVIRKLSKILPRNSLIAIYKSFVRLHLDYGDVLYDQPNNESLCQKIESVQYNAAFAITGAIKGTSHMKLYNKLGLESLMFKRWFRTLYLFFKIIKHGLPEYLFDLIPQNNHQYNTHTTEDIRTFYCRTDIFKYSYFPVTIMEWNKTDVKLRKSESLPYFRNALLKVGRPTDKPVHNNHNPIGLKLLTRLRLGLSYLNEHKLKHNFQDCINPLCTCSLEISFCTVIISQVHIQPSLVN